jgi:hypothetical protein
MPAQPHANASAASAASFKSASVPGSHNRGPARKVGRCGVYRYLLVPGFTPAGGLPSKNWGITAVNVGGLMNSHKSGRLGNRTDGELGLDIENLRRRGSFLVC